MVRRRCCRTRRAVELYVGVCYFAHFLADKVIVSYLKTCKTPPEVSFSVLRKLRNHWNWLELSWKLATLSSSFAFFFDHQLSEPPVTKMLSSIFCIYGKIFNFF